MEEMTDVIRVDPDASGCRAGSTRAAECLRRGGLVAFPTETVYGLGVHALDRAAVRRLFEAKGRPANDPLIVHVDTVERMHDAGAARFRSRPASWRERFWPGPLTLVLPRSGRVPDEVTAGLDTVAIRIPAHPVARALLAAAAFPSRRRARTCSRDRARRAPRTCSTISPAVSISSSTAARRWSGVESTVLDSLRERYRSILRPGAVSLDMLRACCRASSRMSPHATDRGRNAVTGAFSSGTTRLARR